MLVTAILPTRGRPQMAWDALECIERQTWSDLEIIILDDSEKPSFTSLSRKLTKSVRYQRSEEQCLGTKLNTACSLANGEYIIRFDDDDWSSPERTADQINRLVESGKAVTSYRNMRFTDGERTWINHNWPGGYGTSLAFRRQWWNEHPFQPVTFGEDWEFVAESMRADQFVAGECDGFLVASIHENHISPRIIGAGWEEITGVR